MELQSSRKLRLWGASTLSWDYLHVFLRQFLKNDEGIPSIAVHFERVYSWLSNLRAVRYSWKEVGPAMVRRSKFVRSIMV